MNLIDGLLVFVVLLSLWSGWRKGFITGMLELAVWLGSLLAAFTFYKYVAIFLEMLFHSLGVWAAPLAFIISVIISRILLSLLVNKLLSSTTEGAHRHGVNRFLGLVPGFINGIIYATLVAGLLLVFPISDGLSAKTRESRFADKLSANVEWLDEKLSPVFDEAVNKTMNKLTVHPSSDKSVKLPYTVTKVKVREDLEAQMLQLVNEERRKEGLKPLKADPELLPVARAHSKDMFARGYFSHVSPEGKAPSDRIRTAGVRFLTAGENLALGQTLSICHQGLMNSPGHRANILHKAYGRVGIGILDGGIYGLMITQNFRN